MDADTIAVITMGISVVGMILWQSSRHENSIKALDTKFDTKIDALDTKFDTKIDALSTKIDTKIDALDTKFTDKLDVMGRDVVDVRERLARVEGHLMGPRSPGVSDIGVAGSGGPPPEDPDAGRSQAV